MNGLLDAVFAAPSTTSTKSQAKRTLLDVPKLHVFWNTASPQSAPGWGIPCWAESKTKFKGPKNLEGRELASCCTRPGRTAARSSRPGNETRGSIGNQDVKMERLMDVQIVIFPETRVAARARMTTVHLPSLFVGHFCEKCCPACSPKDPGRKGRL